MPKPRAGTARRFDRETANPRYDRAVNETKTVAPPEVAVLRGGTPIDVVEEGGSAVALAWPGTGSHFRSMHRIELDARGRTRTLRHEGEAVYFVSSGEGLVGEQPLKAHDMVYVPRR